MLKVSTGEWCCCPNEWLCSVQLGIRIFIMSRIKTEQSQGDYEEVFLPAHHPVFVQKLKLKIQPSPVTICTFCRITENLSGFWSQTCIYYHHPSSTDSPSTTNIRFFHHHVHFESTRWNKRLVINRTGWLQFGHSHWTANIVGICGKGAK